MNSEVSLLGSARIKAEPLSPEQNYEVNCYGTMTTEADRDSMATDHDTVAMQQTYQQREDTPMLNGDEEGIAIDMSCSVQNMVNYGKEGRTLMVNTSMPYMSEPSTSFSMTSHHSNSMYGIYSYPSTTDEKPAGTNLGNISKGSENGMTGTQQNGPVKTRHTALPGMGKRSHLPKRYKCAMCAYRTRYKSDLNRHVRKHAVATYNCDVCNMPFKTVGNVEFHKRKEHSEILIQNQVNKDTSTTGMKHSCNYCTYGTMYSSDLTRHLRKHYAAKFHCNVCNRPFMTSGSLVHHKRTVHDLHDVEVIMGPEGIESVNQAGSKSEPLKDDENVGGSDDDLKSQTLFAGVLNLTKINPNGDKKTDDESVVREKKEQCDNNNSKLKINKNIISLETDSGLSAAEVGNAQETETKASIKRNTESYEPVNSIGAPNDNSNITKHTCEYCHKSFGRKLVLEYHLKNIHKVINSDSETAFVEYPGDDYDLALDMSIQELENSTSDFVPEKINKANHPEKFCYQCQFCAYATNYKSTFDRHVKKHDLECHICNVCRMPFITFGHLQRHIRDNHPDHIQSISRKEVTSDKQVCSYCDYVAENLCQLQAHCQHQHGQIVGQTYQRKSVVKTQQVSPSAGMQVGFNLSDVEMGDNDVQYVPTRNENIMTSDDVMKKTHAQNQSWSEPRKPSISDDDVTVSPPSHGRYAKLVSDYENFAERPFACALCFFRTSDLNILVKHAENHLTGCNPDPVPETAVFSVNRHNVDYSVISPSSSSSYNPPFVPSHIYHSVDNKSYPSTNMPKDYERRVSTTCGYVTGGHSNNAQAPYVGKSDVYHSPQISNKIKHSTEEENANILTNLTEKSELANEDISMGSRPYVDRLIPTFSVHYRKDKTNKIRPYLCLLCRKRFKHLTFLKQHFRQAHNDYQAAVKPFNCRLCNKEFENPMLLQEHHEVHH